MSSSQQFPSELNNWVDSDKPIREDFVQDNHLLDENALWKQDYDADGNVAEARGIPAFVQANQGMREADYDPEGEVKTAGGIADYVEQISILECSHVKVGTVHQLTNPNAGDANIKFIATADYAVGDTFTVNGTDCTAQTVDGGPLDDRCIKEGAAVVCVLTGSILTFQFCSIGALLVGLEEVQRKIAAMTPETGSNANGSWEKYPDGKLVCYKTITATVNANILWTSGTSFWVGVMNLGYWPQGFKSTPMVSHGFSTNNGVFVGPLLPAVTATNAGEFLILRPLPTNGIGMTVWLTATGRWK